MQFNEYVTFYQLLKRESKKRRKSFSDLPINDWYDWATDDKEIRKHGLLNSVPDEIIGNSLTMLQAEQDWVRTGQPYYKVFPGMASMMSEISIDIPIDEFGIPYNTFMIMLANDPSNDFWEYVQPDVRGPRLKTVLVHLMKVIRQPDAEKFLLFDPAKHDPEDMSYGLYLDYGFDGKNPDGEDNRFNFTLSLDPRYETIEKFFDKVYPSSLKWMSSIYKVKTGEYAPGKDMLLRIIKLAVATSFFGIDQHEIVMPDITRKKLEKRIKGAKGNIDQVKAEIREQKSDTKAWTIGREISLPKPLAEHFPHKGTGSRHTHAYMRRGHMRWQVYGEGRTQRKLIFIHPHLCREDLAITPRAGFKITDKNLPGVK